MFRTQYAGTIDIVDTETALYHDALHSLTGLGIDLDSEIKIRIVEAWLREEEVREEELNTVLRCIRSIPEFMIPILKEYYIK